MHKKNKRYSKEFKQDAVNYYYYSSDKSIKDAASDLNISSSGLADWIKSAKLNDGIINHRSSGNYSSNAEKEIARLKKELKNKEDAPKAHRHTE